MSNKKTLVTSLPLKLRVLRAFSYSFVCKYCRHVTKSNKQLADINLQINRQHRKIFCQFPSLQNNKEYDVLKTLLIYFPNVRLFAYIHWSKKQGNYHHLTVL